MSIDSWIHNFAITETINHENKYTLYKITAIIFPRHIPEALSNVSIWRRYSEIKKFYKEIKAKQKLYRLKGAFPKFFDQKLYFTRFNARIIEERKSAIIEFLYYIAQHPVLYKSESFISFFNNNRTFQPSSTESSITEAKPSSSRDEVDNHQLPMKLSNSIEVKDKPPEPELDDIELASSADSISNNYIYEAALEFSNALQSDVNGAYDIAFQKYTSGVGILLTGARNDTDVERQTIAKEKAQKYLGKADDIYQTFLSNDHFVDLAKDAEIVTDVDETYLKLPVNTLTRYRIIKIINSVLQVQDIKSKNIVIMKIIQKYASGTLYFGKRIPYMVPVLNYIETDDSIFVLIKQANGGKLWDYITKIVHHKSGFKKSNLNDLFVEKSRYAKSQLSMSISSLLTNETNGLASPKSSSCSLNDYNTNLGELSNKIKELDSILSFDKISDSEEVTSNLSELDTYELVDSSQELLKSVSETLEWSNSSPPPVKIPSVIEEIEPAMEATSLDCLPEGSIRRWIAELIVAIENLHQNNIVCGDLRMDNLLLGNSGQLQITLFCVQHKNDADVIRYDFDYSSNLYVAPERPITTVSDWWSVGIILFELLFLKPFYFYHPDGIYKYYSIQYPQTGISKEAKSLLKGLLTVDPAKRYDITSIKSHSFFKDVNWAEVYRNGFL